MLQLLIANTPPPPPHSFFFLFCLQERNSDIIKVFCFSSSRKLPLLQMVPLRPCQVGIKVWSWIIKAAGCHRQVSQVAAAVAPVCSNKRSAFIFLPHLSLNVINLNLRRAGKRIGLGSCVHSDMSCNWLWLVDAVKLLTCSRGGASVRVVTQSDD